MPLQTSQCEFINHVIQHLISDLPKEEKALQLATENLHNAFTHSLNEANEFYFLQQCIHEPWFYLRRIEESNRDITIGDVQQYLFEQVNKKIHERVSYLGMKLASLPWNRDNSVVNRIHNDPSYAKKLVSRSLAIRDDTPIYALPTVDRMFSATLVPRISSSKVDLSMTIHLSPPKRAMIFLQNFPDNLNNNPQDTQFDQFMKELEPKALLEAEREAKSILITYLVHSHKIHQKQTFSESGKLILTHRYYFQLINNNHYSDLIALKNISKKEYHALIDPIVIHLLRNKKCYINQAKHFTKNECYNLKFPFISNLLFSNVINLRQARNASEGTKKLLTNEFFYSEIKQNKLSLDVINALSLELCQYICSSQLVELFRKNKINLYSITLHSAKLLHDNPILLFLYSQELITLPELHRLNIHASTVVTYSFEHYLLPDKNKVRLFVKAFIQLAENDILEPEDLITLFNCLENLCRDRIKSPDEAIKILLSTQEIKYQMHVNLMIRLQSLLDQKPQILSDDIHDTFERLHADTHECGVDLFEVIDKEIARRTRSCLLGNANALSPFYTYQYQLNLATFELSSHYFAQRVFAIYLKHPYKIDNTLDDMTKIIQEIHAKERGLSSPHLTSACIKQILCLLKDDISPILETQPAPAVYQKIFDEIVYAMDKTRLRRGKDPFFCRWQYAFEQVIIIAQKEMQKMTAHQPAQPKRARLNFSPGMFIALPSGIAEFCTCIQLIAPICHPENFQRNRLQA